MSKIDPAPPEGKQFSPVPRFRLEEAVEWCRAELQFPVTARWLKESTNRGDLEAAIVGGRRLYSQDSLWRFAISRPQRKVSRRPAAGSGRNSKP